MGRARDRHGTGTDWEQDGYGMGMGWAKDGRGTNTGWEWGGHFAGAERTLGFIGLQWDSRGTGMEWLQIMQNRSRKERKGVEQNRFNIEKE